jgi:hypothetical protein
MTLSSTPSLPSQEALNDLKKALRPNATIIGAITLSCEPQTVRADAGLPCVLVIWTGDDHVIYKTEMCETGPGQYELGPDIPVGTW